MILRLEIDRQPFHLVWHLHKIKNLSDCVCTYQIFGGGHRTLFVPTPQRFALIFPKLILVKTRPFSGHSTLQNLITSRTQLSQYRSYRARLHPRSVGRRNLNDSCINIISIRALKRNFRFIKQLQMVALKQLAWYTS